MIRTREYRSCFRESLSEFSRYMMASHHWSSGYDYTLISFDRYCSENYPDATRISQEMVDSWCRKRDTENNTSCHTRQCSVVAFIRFLRDRGIADIKEPERPRKERSSYIPHAFSSEELHNFFEACDTIYSNSSKPKKSFKLKKITVPVLFRLLYSTGMRTCEARLLSRKDVDFSKGVIGIRQSKGEQQRYVPMHPTLLTLLQKYDSVADKLCPDRAFFFQSPRGGSYKNAWLTDMFREMWYKKNTSRATAYELRHHYAIVNINTWNNMGFGTYDRLLYLSKSMGHVTVESTRGYYAIVPALADTITEKTAVSSEWILPDL